MPEGPTTPNYEPIKIYLSILMDEYKVVREHGRQANVFRGLILQIGTAIYLGMLSAAAAQWPSSNGMAPLILLLLIPVFSSVSLLTWVGEAHVFGRSREYACLLERKVHVIINEIGLPLGLSERWPPEQRRLESWLRLNERDPLMGPLSWETWGRHSRPDGRADQLRDDLQRHAFSAVRFLFFPVLMVVSLILGQVQLHASPTDVFGTNGWRVVVAIGYTIVGVSVALGLYAMWIFRPIRRQSWIPPSVSDAESGGDVSSITGA